MRIVYMGTPDFAVASMKALAEAGHEIVAVVTSPDKPAGRGLQISESAVKKAALQLGFTILQPVRLKDPDFLASLQQLQADLFVVVAFRMLPAEVWKIPPKGTINLHASLLPQYRGAAPINHAIINGETITGVTTFFINENIDTGSIIESTPVEISRDETAGSLHDKLMTEGAALLVKTLWLIESKQCKPRPQKSQISGELKTAPKIFRDNCRIDWNLPGEQIRNFIRGLYPYPGAFTTLVLTDGTQKTLKIGEAGFVSRKHALATGEISSHNNKFQIAVADGFIEIFSLQLEGKKNMKTGEFLRGFDLKNVRLKL